MSIQTINLSRLGGFSGSNPEVLCTFPEPAAVLNNMQNEILKHSLPDGVLPNSFSLLKVGDKHYLSYVFALKEDATRRDDLASISVVIDENKVNLDDFQVLFKHIVISIVEQTEMEISAQLLVENMDNLYNGINNLKKVTIGDLVIDIPSLIKKNKLKISKKIQVKGRLS